LDKKTTINKANETLDSSIKAILNNN